MPKKLPVQPLQHNRDLFKETIRKFDLRKVDNHYFLQFNNTSCVVIEEFMFGTLDLSIRTYASGTIPNPKKHKEEKIIKTHFQPGEHDYLIEQCFIKNEWNI